MESETYKSNGGADLEKACRTFLLEHTGTPGALLGGQMEREAFLDTLLVKTGGRSNSSENRP